MSGLFVDNQLEAGSQRLRQIGRCHPEWRTSLGQRPPERKHTRDDTSARPEDSRGPGPELGPAPERDGAEERVIEDEINLYIRRPRQGIGDDHMSSRTDRVAQRTGQARHELDSGDLPARLRQRPGVVPGTGTRHNHTSRRTQFRQPVV